MTYGDIVIEHIDFYGSIHTAWLGFCGMMRCVAVRPHTAMDSNVINYGKQHIVLASAISCIDVLRLTLPHVNMSPYIHVHGCGLR